MGKHGGKLLPTRVETEKRPSHIPYVRAEWRTELLKVSGKTQGEESSLTEWAII